MVGFAPRGSMSIPHTVIYTHGGGRLGNQVLRLAHWVAWVREPPGAGEIREAALKYNEYIESKPKENMSVALLRMGDCFKQLGDAETAKIYYQELIQKYSGTSEAKQAKDKLAKL